MIYNRTIYKLSWGSRHPEQTRYFGPCHLSDACLRFSEQVISLDKDPEVSGAYVNLVRLPDSIYPEGMALVAWTKTSDERPTIPGFLTTDGAN